MPDRIFVFKNVLDSGLVVTLEDSIETLKKKISSQFQISKEDLKLYLANGCEIRDITVLRDEDKIYLDHEGTHEQLNTSLSKQENRTASDWIRLNVGGKHFMTSRSTLLAKEPLSMLARMFAGDNNGYLMNPSTKDESGAYLIDRSPEYFEPILNYLRHGQVILDRNVNPKGVLEEAIFYGEYIC